ncbi:hypothetical protein [Streptomyces europaeiscabiei]|uniref:hypothetical protein n=1 Tax=Streptomyces europaeiscabiei TaxID=146819 RepID=UPI0038F73ADC
MSALNGFLGDEQLVLEPRFGGEERLRATASGDDEVPDLALFHRVRGGTARARELRSRIAALPGTGTGIGIDTAYVKPGAVPASVDSAGSAGSAGSARSATSVASSPVDPVDPLGTAATTVPTAPASRSPVTVPVWTPRAGAAAR